MASSDEKRTAFRCVIAPENSAAKISVGRKCYDAAVVNVSRTAFTVRIPTRLAKKISPLRVCRLAFAQERWEVRKESVEEDGNFSHVGFTRVREITKLRVPSTAFASAMPKFGPKTDPELLLCLLIAFIVACVSLPGIGDNLGTAPRVRNGIATVWQALTSLF